MTVSCMSFLGVSSHHPVAVHWQFFILWKMSVSVLRVEGCGLKEMKGPELRERMNRKNFGHKSYTKSFAKLMHLLWKIWSIVWNVGTCIWP